MDATAYDLVPISRTAGNSVIFCSMCGYLFYPNEESGYDFAERYPHIGAWVERMRAIPGWVSPYDILPGKAREESIAGLWMTSATPPGGKRRDLMSWKGLGLV
ncbi:hypothetical protein RY831_02450 [Noviherbaspirillum sp. CPCC 100848]|uniref:Glutathione S-transferase n=1 Tax=Noviherbaspirillum album TaxID=3080276 RepID=A0ABU6J3Q1_9BURK|nr:hypothetical protein [Noviherbaspirillum sp. CPCC 100848]MEC4718000.1 hypothetical protein [Noviherbaspirillum sp. CPCC 100848]